LLGFTNKQSVVAYFVIAKRKEHWDNIWFGTYRAPLCDFHLANWTNPLSLNAIPTEVVMATILENKKRPGRRVDIRIQSTSIRIPEGQGNL
jgi:hypothetical protein